MSNSLLKLNSNELTKLAVDCFISIMRYMGDHPMAKGQTEVDCVYTVLVVCVLLTSHCNVLLPTYNVLKLFPFDFIL